MYACSQKSEADFSEGSALPIIAYTSVKTHPYRLTIRERFCASIVSGRTRARASLFTAAISCVRR